MAYVKKIWKGYPDTTTPITPEDLNNIENGIEAVDTVVNNGWIPLTGTFAYSSADSPTFVMSTSVDLTGIVGLGMRIKLTQATTKYFIVTAITTSSITMYGGTDYTLTSDAISNVYYSMLKAPYGFPLNISKWSIVGRFTGDQSNISGRTAKTLDTIILPIGAWNIQTSGYSTWYTTANAPFDGQIGFSTSIDTSPTTIGNHVSSIDTTNSSGNIRINSGVIILNYSVTSKTTLYWNIFQYNPNATYRGNTYIAAYAICAYL